MLFGVIPFAYLITAAIAVSVAVIAGRIRGVSGAGQLSLLMIAVSIYALMSAFEVAAVTVEGKEFWMKLEYFGIATTPPLFLAFTIAYTGWRTRFARYLQFFAWTVSLATFLAVWTNTWLGLHWQGLDLHPVTGLLSYDRGPFFPVWVSGAYITVLAGTVLLLRSAFQNRRIFQAQSFMLLAATLCPWIGNTLYLSEANPIPGMDWTPAVFTLTGLLLGLAIFRFGLLSLRPVARTALIESMREGMIVVDVEGRIVDANPAAPDLLGRIGRIPLGGKWHAAVSLLAERISTLPDTVGRPVEIEIETGENTRVIEADVSPFETGGGQMGGHLIVLRDITARRRAESEREKLIGELQETVKQVQMLEGLLPVCSNCHRIRNDTGEWERMDIYIQERSQVEFSHSICPECARKLYPGLQNKTGSKLPAD